MGSRIGARKGLARRLGITLDELDRRQAAGEKYCWRCTAWHPVAEFRRDASRSDGLASACSRSMAEAARAAYQPRPRISKKGQFFAETRNGDAAQARHRVRHRVDIGLLSDPNALPCKDCGHVWKPGERRHEYDHHKGYAAEHQLDVEPVCTTCHAAREAARGKRFRARGARGRFTEAA